MDLPQDFLELLVCPEARAPLQYFPDGQKGAAPGTVLAGPFLFCPESKLAYPVLEDGIPVLLVDEAHRLSDEDSASLVGARESSAS